MEPKDASGLTAGADRVRAAGGVDPERVAAEERAVRRAARAAQVRRGGGGVRAHPRPVRAARRGPDRDRGKGQRRKEYTKNHSFSVDSEA